MKPLLQVFALDNIIEEIPGMNRLKIRGIKRKIDKLEETGDKLFKKTTGIKQKLVKEVLFNPILKNIKQKQNNDAKKEFISSFFG